MLVNYMAAPHYEEQRRRVLNHWSVLRGTGYFTILHEMLKLLSSPFYLEGRILISSPNKM